MVWRLLQLEITYDDAPVGCSSHSLYGGRHVTKQDCKEKLIIDNNYVGRYFHQIHLHPFGREIGHRKQFVLSSLLQNKLSVSSDLQTKQDLLLKTAVNPPMDRLSLVSLLP